MHISGRRLKIINKEFNTVSISFILNDHYHSLLYAHSRIIISLSPSLIFLSIV
jgi:hypothetical protein